MNSNKWKIICAILSVCLIIAIGLLIYTIKTSNLALTLNGDNDTIPIVELNE